MNDAKIPMIPGRKMSLPRVYGDTPTFLGVPHVKNIKGVSADAAIMGVPWEGTITWGSYSGCELTPKTVRHAAARYGGYLPEFDIDLFDHLHLVDVGDVAVTPGDEYATMHSIEERCFEVFNNGTVPFIIGGDHSFTPAVIKALARIIDGPIGIVHLDAHFDNAQEYGTDAYPRCGPIHHIANLPDVKNSSVVQFGIRGPRNSKWQMEHARELGVSVMTINDIRTNGFEPSVDKAISIAYDGTKAVYVTVCSDILDAVFNPGGPADFDGLSPRELFYMLRKLGEKGIAGLDYVEVYPLQDKNGLSSHLIVWAMIHALAGCALKKRSEVQ